jgi:hypothetical protein
VASGERLAAAGGNRLMAQVQVGAPSGFRRGRKDRMASSIAEHHAQILQANASQP